jgi:hypothetical protein
MSSRHAPGVRSLITASWPQRYQSMPLLAALRALHVTGRVYKNSTTLTDMRSGGETSTLLPRDWDAAGPAPLEQRGEPEHMPHAAAMSAS